MASLAIGQFGPGQILLLLAVFLLFFGGSRLPGLARSLGASLTEFKKGLRGEDDEEKKIDPPEDDPPAATEKDEPKPTE